MKTIYTTEAWFYYFRGGEGWGESLLRDLLTATIFWHYFREDATSGGSLLPADYGSFYIKNI